MTLFSLGFALSYVLVGELPLSIIKMTTEGVTVYLQKNTGFTLPLNMGELGNIEKLDLSLCSRADHHARGSHPRGEYERWRRHGIKERKAQ